jgi:hypothetical protein
VSTTSTNNANDKEIVKECTFDTDTCNGKITTGQDDTLLIENYRLTSDRYRFTDVTSIRNI